MNHDSNDEKIRMGCLKLAPKWGDAASKAGIKGYGHIRGLEHANIQSSSSNSSSNTLEDDFEYSTLKNQIESEIILTSNSPQVTFEDIIGLEDPKRLLNEAILLPKMVPEFFQGMRAPWKGIYILQQLFLNIL